MKFKRKNKIYIVSVALVLIVAVVISVFNFTKTTRAEQSGSSPESGETSRLLTGYNVLVALGFGSDAAGAWGDWGAMWNRTQSAARWVPSGDVAAGDVRTGKTFYSASRTQETGTLSGTAVAACSTQQYMDSYGAPVTQTTNCVNNISWTDPGDAITGTDKKDNNTGVIWSKYLKNNAGTVEFADTGGSQWSWDASGANNIAVGTKTASQLCSERGDGWRLPTQKELMQAYIDGSFFNLTNPSNSFWSVTEYSATGAYCVYLSSGSTSASTKTAAAGYVRCVR